MTEYWFKPKLHGYGAVPSSWKGWAAMLAFAALLVGGSMVLMVRGEGGAPPSNWRVGAWFLYSGALTVWFIRFCRRRTDGEWRWRWGKAAQLRALLGGGDGRDGGQDPRK